MKAILADVHITNEVSALVAAMQREPWTEFWVHLGITLYQFEDLGLTLDSSDLEIWQCCQNTEVVLITNNRNDKFEDSLQATIESFNTPSSLPVFTIGNLGRLKKSAE